MQKHATSIVACGTALLLAAGTAWAQGQPGSSAQRGSTSGSAHSGAAGTSGMEKSAGSQQMSMHRAQGTIRSIDKSKGNVQIDLANGERVTLNLPQRDLEDFDQGDRVVVATQLKAAEGAGATGASGGTMGSGSGSMGSGAGSASGSRAGSAGSAGGTGTGSSDATR